MDLFRKQGLVLSVGHLHNVQSIVQYHKPRLTQVRLASNVSAFRQLAGEYSPHLVFAVNNVILLPPHYDQYFRNHGLALRIRNTIWDVRFVLSGQPTMISAFSATFRNLHLLALPYQKMAMVRVRQLLATSPWTRLMSRIRQLLDKSPDNPWPLSLILQPTLSLQSPPYPLPHQKMAMVRVRQLLATSPGTRPLVMPWI